jgi:hypothetical protein
VKKLERLDIGDMKRNTARLERPARPPRGHQWPNFDTLFVGPNINPLDAMDMTGDPEQDADAEGEVTQTAFMQNEKEQLDAYRQMIDSEFFLVVCFQSRAQKEEFLQKSGLEGPGISDKYLDGLRVAKHFGIDVAPIPLPTKKPSLMPRALRDIKIIPKGGDS